MSTEPLHRSQQLARDRRFMNWPLFWASGKSTRLFWFHLKMERSRALSVTKANNMVKNKNRSVPSHKRDIIIDTNLLLLLIIGSVEEGRFIFSRSEERREGKGCVGTCKHGWLAEH